MLSCASKMVAVVRSCNIEYGRGYNIKGFMADERSRLSRILPEGYENTTVCKRSYLVLSCRSSEYLICISIRP